MAPAGSGQAVPGEMGASRRHSALLNCLKACTALEKASHGSVCCAGLRSGPGRGFVFTAVSNGSARTAGHLPVLPSHGADPAPRNATRPGFSCVRLPGTGSRSRRRCGRGRSRRAPVPRPGECCGGSRAGLEPQLPAQRARAPAAARLAPPPRRDAAAR